MDSIIPTKSDLKSQELKEKLLTCLDREARQFSEIARGYFSREQLSPEDRVGLLKTVIEAVDHVMQAGDWDSSLFLRNTLKPLTEIKSEAEQELSKLSHSSEKKSFHVQPASEDEQEVCISLFQSDGYNMGKWAMQLRSLDRYIVGRPVYGAEEDVKNRIKLRSAASNEAYVVVIVKKTDVQREGVGSTTDSFGRTLLGLKEHALQNGRVKGFVHQDTLYHFVDGQLIP